jgi:hypothetical protein
LNGISEWIYKDGIILSAAPGKMQSGAHGLAGFSPHKTFPGSEKESVPYAEDAIEIRRIVAKR